MDESQKNKYAKYNLILGILNQVMMILLSLISKQAVKENLGIDYLGIQTVYSNFIDIFTLVFVGIGSSFLYRLYHPLEHQNYLKARSLYKFYKKIANVFSASVLVVGSISIIFVVWTINVDVEAIEIIVTYSFFLIATVIISKSSVSQHYIIANQKQFIIWSIMLGFEIFFIIIQVITLYLFKSFYYFMGLVLIKNILINFSYTMYLKKNYKYLYQKELTEITEKKEIYKDIKDLIFTKVGDVMIHSTDSIIISIFVSTLVGGLFANYLFVYLGVANLACMYFTALTARIGNYMVTHSKEKVFSHFISNSAINVWITGFCVTAFYCLIQPFIEIWMGEEALLSNEIVVFISINLFLYCIRAVTATYRYASGLFSKISVIFVVRGIVNIILSIILGYLFGLIGVLLATLISNVTIAYVYEAVIVYRYFNKSMIGELIYQILAIGSVIVSIIITVYILSFVTATGIIGFILKVFICLTVINIYYLGLFLIYKILRKR